MAGREKIPCFQYSINGEYIKKYNSISEFRDEYFSEQDGKQPLFHKGQEMYIMPDETVVCKHRIGRENVKKLVKISTNKLIAPYESKTAKKPIELFNIVGEKIAEFENIRTMSILMDITKNTAYSMMRERKGNMPSNELGVTAKFKAI
jgi:hypothetical protein